MQCCKFFHPEARPGFVHSWKNLLAVKGLVGRGTPVARVETVQDTSHSRMILRGLVPSDRRERKIAKDFNSTHGNANY